jgi:hypothetical protein
VDDHQFMPVVQQDTQPAHNLGDGIFLSLHTLVWVFGYQEIAINYYNQFHKVSSFTNYCHVA